MLPWNFISLATTVSIPATTRALLIRHSILQPGPWQWLQNHSLGCIPHPAQTVTHIRVAVVFLSTSCNRHFSPYLKFKTFFSFTMKFKLSQFEAQRKQSWKAHSTKLINSWLLHWCTGDKKETGDKKWHFGESYLSLQKYNLCIHPLYSLCYFSQEYEG